MPTIKGFHDNRLSNVHLYEGKRPLVELNAVGTVPHLATLFGAVKRADFPVFVSPHFLRMGNHSQTAPRHRPPR
jgi:hypothetical protein